MKLLIWIMLGGAVGSGLRYLASATIERAFAGVFPFGTLAVNIAGSFAIGIVMTLLGSASVLLVSPEVRAFITVGVLGGFTTFSSFSWQTVALFEDRQQLHAWANIFCNVAVCLLATVAGVMLARAFVIMQKL